MESLLHQIKRRRLALRLKQNDMPLRVGVSRQQYQRLESKGNPRLNTLELLAKGLNSEIKLIPNEKLDAVLALLEAEDNESASDSSGRSTRVTKQAENSTSLSDDPWQGLLGDEQ